jgi:hypothetical protein
MLSVRHLNFYLSNGLTFYEMPDRYISKYNTWITLRYRVYKERALLIQLSRLQVPPKR